MCIFHFFFYLPWCTTMTFYRTTFLLAITKLLNIFPYVDNIFIFEFEFDPKKNLYLNSNIMENL